VQDVKEEEKPPEDQDDGTVKASQTWGCGVGFHCDG